MYAIRSNPKVTKHLARSIRRALTNSSLRLLQLALNFHVQLLRSARADVVLNACDPRFVMPIFDAAYETGTTYLDMAMSLSHPHPEEPYAKPGVAGSSTGMH